MWIHTTDYKLCHFRDSTHMLNIPGFAIEADSAQNKDVIKFMLEFF